MKNWSISILCFFLTYCEKPVKLQQKHYSIDHWSFEEGKQAKNQDLQKEELSREAKRFQQNIKEAFSDSSVFENYGEFKKFLPKAQRLEQVSFLFQSFVRSPSFHPSHYTKQIEKKFIQTWVSDAQELKQENLRNYYSDYLQKIYRHIKRYHFYINTQKIRPGHEIKIHGCITGIKLPKIFKLNFLS